MYHPDGISSAGSPNPPQPGKGEPFVSGSFSGMVAGMEQEKTSLNGIPIVRRNIKIRGESIQIGILSDIPWGDFLKIIEGSDEGGAFSKTRLIQGLLEAAVVEGIEVRNQSELKKLGSLDMTGLIKEVLDVLPLQTYFTNLGGGDIKDLGLTS